MKHHIVIFFLALLFTFHPTQSQSSVPLYQWFEPNLGQSDAQFDFIARDRGYMMFMDGREIAYSLLQPSESTDGHLTFVNLHMELLNANANPMINGVMPLPGVSNYFKGSNTFTNIPHYGGVNYGGVYPGIDMLYYSSGGRLHYDFNIAAGVDPRQIQLRFRDAERLEIAANGDLLIYGPHNNILTHRAPYSYQPVNGQRQEAAVRYVLHDDHTVGFDTLHYDATQPLVIDPPVIYSTYISGLAENESATGITTDASGNAYIAGQAFGAGYPTTPGAFDGTMDGISDLFVSKISADGSTLLYSTYLGGSDQEVYADIDLDSSGNIYIAGFTTSTDYPVTASAYLTTGHLTLSKLNPTGNALLYSTRWGGTSGDELEGVAVDDNGNAYITGYTSSTDFQVKNALSGNLSGGRDAFVTRFDTNASGEASLVYSTYLGGTGQWEGGHAIAVDASGHAYVTGEAASNNFPTTANAYDRTLGGARDAFVTRINTNASGPGSLVYSTLIGGTFGNSGLYLGADIGYGIDIDHAGNAYITGETYAPDFPVTSGAFDTVFNTSSFPTYDGFVAKFNTNGNGASSLVFATFLGGSSLDDMYDIAVVSTGAYVTGYTSSNDFPLMNPSHPGHPNTLEAFLTAFSTDGSSITFSTYVGGSEADLGFALAVDNFENVYLTGITQSADFPVTSGAYGTTLTDWRDIFIVKMGDVPPTPIPATETFTPLPPTATFTRIPPTQTYTPIPATETLTPTNTNIPATATLTLIPPTSTATETPTATTTPTPLPPGSVELLLNGGFETGTVDNLPDIWTLKNLSKDRRRCNSESQVLSFRGSCTFIFRGTPAESTQLLQFANLEGYHFQAGDTLTFGIQYRTKGTTSPKLHLKLLVFYGDQVVKERAAVHIVRPTYTLFNVPVYNIDPAKGTITAIKVIIQNKTKNGKVFVDDASLIFDPLDDNPQN